MAGTFHRCESGLGSDIIIYCSLFVTEYEPLQGNCGSQSVPVTVLMG